MTFTAKNKRLIISLFVVLLVACFLSVFWYSKDSKASANAEMAEKLASRNGADALFLVIEQATEAGDNYIEAKNVLRELLLVYAEHMNKRDLDRLLQNPPFSEKDVAKKINDIAEDMKAVSSENKAREKILGSAKDLAQFLVDSDLFTNEDIINFEREDLPSEKQVTIIKTALEEANKNVERYANSPQSLDVAKEACMANRKAIAYLYLYRFVCQEIIDEKLLKRFRTDINRTIFYNQRLQETMKENSEKHDRLVKYTNSEIRRLWLLQAIIEKDIQLAQALLQKAIIEALPDIQF